MELVYLWVEEYKNIKNQGFNFSPRFNCEYNEDTNELTIDENKEYISIFPDNINITAIVGENGSGKSSIIRLIFRLIYQLTEDKWNKQRFFLILTTKKKEQILIQSNININSTLKTIYNNNFGNTNPELNKFSKNQYFLLVDFTLSRFGLKNQIKNDFKTSYSLEPSKIIFANTHHDKINTEAVTSNIQNYAVLGYLYLFFNKVDSISLPIAKKIKLKNRNGKDRDEDFKKLINESSFIETINMFIHTTNISDLKSIDNKIKNSQTININNLQSKIKKLYFIFSLYDLELIFDNGMKFDKLSTGQTYLLCYLGYILRYIYYCENNNKESITIIIDECETSLHPSWQKQTIKFFLDSIRNIDTKINFIFTTHSPFILSDLPKENVIFLQKDKNGNCKNVTNETEIDTFGANIHTLLSHGFFMQDGLMGEFAKSKIRSISVTYKYIQYRHNKKNLFKKEHRKSRRYIRNQMKNLWYIQSIIGEKFVKTITKNQLQEVEQILYGQIEAIDKEIERLDKIKKSLKNASN